MIEAHSVPRIDSIDAIEVCVPRTASNRIATSYAELPDARHALVTVRAEGLVGIGEAPAELWWTGEDATSVRNAVERYLAPALVGREAWIRDCVERMDAALAANPYAKAAIEMALWDLAAKAADLPLYALLGGGPPRPIPIKYVIGIVEPERAREQVDIALELGFSWVKVKVGRALDDDLRRLEAVADQLGARGRFGVDANGGWPLPTALAALPELEALGVRFVEQPVSAQYPGAMAELTARSTIPTVAHESVFSVRDGLEAAAGRYAHIWALTPPTHGGLLRTAELLGIARAAGIPCLLGSTVELGVATAFLAQIGAAFSEIPACPIPSDVIGPLYHDGDIVLEQPRIENGHVYVPSGAGLGVELDEAAVARFSREQLA